MSTTILISHIDGSKANKIDRFPLDSSAELTIGRDPSARISYDPLRDDMVSRRHAVIIVTQTSPPGARITDLGSANGTLVNGEVIATATELLPTDIVQLGRNGPSFIFDLDPRPLNTRTRVIATASPAVTKIVGSAGAAVPATTVSGDVSSSAKSTIGRQTLMGILSVERAKSTRTWLGVVAGIVAVVAIGGAGLFGWMQNKQQETEAKQQQTATQVAQATALAQLNADDQKKKLEEAQKRLTDQIGMTPAKIAEKFGASVVHLTMRWRLYDAASGKPLFHKTMAYENRILLPVYVILKDGRVVRWLTTEDSRQTNKEVGFGGTGTGFVVSDDGFIMTNKHVAAPWAISYSNFSAYEDGRAFVCPEGAFSAQDLTRLCKAVPDLLEYGDLIRWTPKDGGQLFDANAPFRLGQSTHRFDGRNEALEVRFPGARQSVRGDLVSFSPDADVAVIKISPVTRLVPLEISQVDDVTLAGNVTVIGYPGASLQDFAVTTTKEAGVAQLNREFIPAITVNTGVISRLTAAQQTASGAASAPAGTRIDSTLGDVYQLTATASAGNSGGPVFDSHGKVIAIFTYGSTKRETNTYAVPIHYGREMIPAQRRN